MPAKEWLGRVSGGLWEDYAKGEWPVSYHGTQNTILRAKNKKKIVKKNSPKRPRTPAKEWMGRVREDNAKGEWPVSYHGTQDTILRGKNHKKGLPALPRDQGRKQPSQRK